ncbi:MAG: ADP-ribosylation factor-like protein [Candidatus Hodarchaeales archaeon]
MTLISIKVFDSNKSEILSSISAPSFDNTDVSAISKKFSDFLSKNFETDFIQGLIIDNHLITFIPTLNYFLAIISTLNTSMAKLNSLLSLLSEALPVFLEEYGLSNEDFQCLCESLVQRVESQPTIKIALLGLDKSGKTTFLENFEEERSLTSFESYKPTRLLNIVKTRVSQIPFSLQFYDLGMSFRQNWWMFSKECDAFIYFVDSNDVERRGVALELLQELRNFWDCPFVVAVNKIDTCKIKNVRKHLARKFRVPAKRIYEVNTLTGTGLIPMLEGLIFDEIQGTKIAVTLLAPNQRKKK